MQFLDMDSSYNDFVTLKNKDCGNGAAHAFTSCADLGPVLRSKLLCFVMLLCSGSDPQDYPFLSYV